MRGVVCTDSHMVARSSFMKRERNCSQNVTGQLATVTSPMHLRCLTKGIIGAMIGVSMRHLGPLDLLVVTGRLRAARYQVYSFRTATRHYDILLFADRYARFALIVNITPGSRAKSKRTREGKTIVSNWLYRKE